MPGKFTEWARTLLFLDSGIHIDGNRELFIENCRRIEECNEICMRLVSGGLRVSVWGSGLRAYDYRTGGLIIRGRIARVELDEGGKNGEEAAERCSQDNS
ncbi:MAG: YabP/YqfC family sporulation protein [Ruminococcus sp.]|nr:YabP/YqfC family sporulation protein [Ruminococcus sp.]